MNELVYETIEDIGQVNLFCHALIEASAGTGKTHTIENLVVRLLLERPEIQIGDILMVTFTEKATSELKIRIRENLEKKADELRGADAVKLRASLDAFETVPIHTIHGFCHAVLLDFAFENNSLFELQLAEDSSLQEAVLKEQIRKDWPACFGDHLYDLLLFSEFHQQKGKFLEKVMRVAESFHPEAGDRLIPDVRPDSVSDILDQMSSFNQRLDRLKRLSHPCGGLGNGFESLNFHKTDIRSVMKRLILPLDACLKEFAGETGGSCLKTVLTVLSSVDENLLNPRKNKGGVSFDACPQWPEIREIVSAMLTALVELRHLLTAWSAKRLISDLRQEKRRRGLIGYDDMILGVYHALCAPGGELLIRRLRKRFKIAFVDEFQDTDRLQWCIFKKIFIESLADPYPENLLFVIGDPKQAIYGFRGADLHAYMEARTLLENLSQRGLATLYSLSVNWRSCAEMVGIFNTLFTSSQWFEKKRETGAYPITYREVTAAPSESRPETLIHDQTGRPALTVIDLSGGFRPRTARMVMARFIADEIRRIVSTSALVWKKRDGTSRTLNFGDIAVLVRTRHEIPVIEEALNARNIPYAYYRKPGLFDSTEALHVSLALHAAWDPKDSSAIKKVLLTPFFGFSLSDLDRVDSLPADHPVKQIFFRWFELARHRRWSRLFQSMMEDTGISFRQSGNSDWERAFTNYRQIQEHLQTVAHEQNLDARGLCALLERYRKGSAAVGENMDILQIDTERSKVQIMTLHVSKGLEFPVVFVAGGFSRSLQNTLYHEFHQRPADDSLHAPPKIIDLTLNADPARHEMERAEENLRLYYVTLTRAKYKLYVPYYVIASNSSWAGPLPRLVAPAIRSAFKNPEASCPVVWISPEKPAESILSEPMQEEKKEPFRIPANDGLPLFPEQGSYVHRKTIVSSFSGILAGLTPAGTQVSAEDFSAVEPIVKENDEPPGAIEWEPASDQEIDPLPGGIDTGSMLHAILEMIPFETVRRLSPNVEGRALLEDPQCDRLIRSRLEHFRIPAHFACKVADLVCDALTCPLPHVEAGFSLCRLDRDNRRHEMEFYYPFSMPQARNPGIPEILKVNGFLMGYIDLVFQHNGKFFIADWKSNRLDRGYHPEALSECMASADYHLQYKIYALATMRWLKLFMKDRFDPEMHFGGVFYFFLRGMGGRNRQGVYFVPGTEVGGIKRLETEIADMLSAISAQVPS